MSESANAILAIHPVTGKERIQSLDILRGFAILGILVMNIQSYSMPEAAYLNPTAYGDLTGANKWVWILSHVFGDQKFMTIFSILYGAGILLVTQNAEERTGKSAGLHYRRNFWLLIIGLIHAHLIWYGDILVAYALCAFLIYLFRKIHPRTQLIIGILLISVHTLFYVGTGSIMDQWPPESVERTMESWKPADEQIQEEIDGYLGSYSEQLAIRTESALFMETAVFFMIFFWRAGGLMLVGMAFYKWGILSAKRSASFYRRGFFISWFIGLPIVAFGVQKNFAVGWSMEYSMFIGSQFNYWGSLFVSFGILCLIMLLAKSGLMQDLKKRFAAIGRTALTNYIFQSVLCTFIFYGVGLGLFGKVDRLGQVLIILGVWTIQLLVTPLWLKKFRFGPIEWLWRSLTYMKRQRFKRGQPSSS